MKIGLIGLGTIGQSVLAILKKDYALIKERTGLELEVVKIFDRSIKKKAHLIENIYGTENINEIILDPEIEVIIEVIGGAEPIMGWIKQALETGKSVVTANKALLALHGNELFSLAYQLGKNLCFEAAVGGSIPIIQNFRRGLVAENINTLCAILNGTSNFILSKMNENEEYDYSKALALAQEKGYAEANPNFDVHGHDAAQKLALLAALAFDVPIQVNAVKTIGIEKIEKIDLKFAKELKYKIKPISIARKVYSPEKKNYSMELCVLPALIPETHFLAKVDQAMNAIMLQGHYIETQIFIGPGAGGVATATSIISDLIAIGQRGNKTPEKWILPKNHYNIDTNFESKFYLRFSCVDKPGVLAEITQFLAHYEISIASIHQHEKKEPVDIAILTHKVSANRIEAILKEMQNLAFIVMPIVSLRIINFESTLS